VLFTLAGWFDDRDDPAAEPLKTPKTIVEPLAVNAAVRALFLDPVVRVLLQQWWSQRIRPRIAEEHRWLADEVFRFDLMTLPITEGSVEQVAVEQVDHVRTCRRQRPSHRAHGVQPVMAAGPGGIHRQS